MILASDLKNFKISVNYYMQCLQVKNHRNFKNWHKISENRCLDPKFGTWKVFGTRKPILTSDFDLKTLHCNSRKFENCQNLRPKSVFSFRKPFKYQISCQEIDFLRFLRFISIFENGCLSPIPRWRNQCRKGLLNTCLKPRLWCFRTIDDRGRIWRWKHLENYIPVSINF